MTMTEQPETKRSRGRPFGTFGPRRRQQNLIAQYIVALGGKVSPIQESDICRAVMLQSIAEQKRHEIDRHGAQSANELLALARLEAVAEKAVRRLRLPVTAINTGVAT